MHIRRLLTGPGDLWITTVLLLIVMSSPIPLSGQDAKTVGGHVGFGFPLVTKDGGNVSSLADNFAMSLPVAITVNGPGRMYFDLELVPIGSRVAFLINHDQTKNAQFGITPLIVKSWPIKHSFFNGYFVEGDFIFRFNRPIDGPATNPFTFNVVLGLSF